MLNLFYAIDFLTQQHIQQLLTAEELGDQKPTQFLCRLQQLAGNTVRPGSIFI